MFDPLIYPMKIWVAIGINTNEIKDNFKDVKTGDDIDTSFIFNNEAVTYYAQKKQDPTYYGVLIASTAKRYFTAKLITHESIHGAEYIWEHISEKIIGSEANAYLAGWIADCIHKTLKNKTVGKHVV